MNQPDDFYHIICNVVSDQREALEAAKKRAEQDYPKLQFKLSATRSYSVELTVSGATEPQRENLSSFCKGYVAGFRKGFTKGLKHGSKKR
jgi:hypothetical protein